jgi:hypothetical protein
MSWQEKASRTKGASIDETYKVLNLINQVIYNMMLDPNVIKTEKIGDETFAFSLEDLLCSGKGEARHLVATTTPHILEIFRVDKGNYHLNQLNKDKRREILANVVFFLVIEKYTFNVDIEYPSRVFMTTSNRVYRSAIRNDVLGGEILSYLCNEYNIIDTREKSILDGLLVNFVRFHVDPINIHYHYFYDQHENILYMHNGKNEYWMLDGESITIHYNGSNGILFDTDVYLEPIEYIPTNGIVYEKISVPGDRFQKQTHLTEEQKNPLYKLAQRCNFENNVLTAEQQEVLYYLVLFAIPFANSLESRPILSFQGKPGAGKSVANKQILKLLRGEGAQAMTLQEDKKDFEVIITRQKFVCLDNVENPPNWFDDMLAAVATSIEIQKRKLYSDFKMISVRPRIIISLTAQNPKWSAPEIAERIIPFNLKKIEKNISLIEYYKPLRAHRNEMMSLYLERLNKIVAMISANSGIIGDSDHRLAEFAILLQLINDAIDVCDPYEMQGILDGLVAQRTAFAVQDKAWFDPLTVVAKLNPGVRYTTGALLEAMKTHAPDLSVSNIGLGRDLATYEFELERLFGMKRWKSNGQRVQSFSKERTMQYDWEAYFNIHHSEYEGMEDDEDKDYPQILLDYIHQQFAETNNPVQYINIVTYGQTQGMTPKYVSDAVDHFIYEGLIGRIKGDSSPGLYIPVT